MNITTISTKTQPESNKPEKLLCAAILYCGEIIAGYRHGDCVNIIEKQNKAFKYDKMSKDIGFLTSKNRFVDRYEAFKIAKKEKQIWHNLHDDVEDNFLISEDLY